MDDTYKTKNIINKVIPQEFYVERDDPAQVLKMQFRGGCKTNIESALLKPGEFSMVQNMRNIHPGLRKRKGCIKLHTTADSTNKVLSLFQFSKGKISEKHFYAQMSDGDVLEATANPPTVTTGAFGSEVIDGTATGQVPASWSVINDMVVYSNGSDGHRIWAGNTAPVGMFVVYKGAEAIPAIPVKGFDYTIEVTDGDSTTGAILDSLGDLAVDYDCIFIMTPIQAKQFTWTVLKANGTTATMKQNYWKSDGTWAADTITDNTADAGATLAVTGSVTWTPATDEIPKYAFGVTGFWKQVYLDTGGDLDSETEISAVTYESNWQNVINIWDGVPKDIIEAQHYDNSAGVYKRYDASYIEINSFEATNDKLYFQCAYPIEAFYIDPGEVPNTTSSTTINAVYYWDGTQFTTVGTITDGSSGLSKPGWVTFARKEAQKTQFGANNAYSYWYYFTTDKTLSASVSIAMTYAPYFDITEWGKGIASCSWKNRQCYVFNSDPNWIAVSKFDQPLKLNGSDFDWLQAGDGRYNKIVAMKNFYQELIVYQEEKGVSGGCITLWEGYQPGTYGRMLISTEIGAMNSKSVVVVDGVGTSLSTINPIAKLAFNLSRKGVFQCDGKNISAISDDISNYFDPSKPECIRYGYESEMWLKYDSSCNCLRLGLVSGSSATLPNVFPVYDLVDKTWSFDVLGQEFSCMEEIEAGSGNIPLLQVAGGVDDGQVYLSNYSSNDVTTAIDGFVTIEINSGGDIINVDELTLRIKAGEGACTLTPYQDGSAQTAKTIT